MRDLREVLMEHREAEVRETLEVQLEVIDARKTQDVRDVRDSKGIH